MIKQHSSLPRDQPRSKWAIVCENGLPELETIEKSNFDCVLHLRAVGSVCRVKKCHFAEHGSKSWSGGVEERS